jgi:hypothetical protein
VPADTELECFRSWTNGLNMMRAVPQCGRFLPEDRLTSIVAVTGARAAFVRECDRDAWAVLIDPKPDASVMWRSGWRAGESMSANGVHVARARR